MVQPIIPSVPLVAPVAEDSAVSPNPSALSAKDGSGTYGADCGCS
ncbi:hypothetical protein [Acinetobacter nosocomialis]|nr:hypothetical protein [Acinetobacter nosocomialis]